MGVGKLLADLFEQCDGLAMFGGQFLLTAEKPISRGGDFGEGAGERLLGPLIAVELGE